MSRKSIAAKVKAARKKAGLSIYALAKKSGVSTAVIADTEHGRSSPRVETLQRIFRPIGWEVAVSFAPEKRHSR